MSLEEKGGRKGERKGERRMREGRKGWQREKEGQGVKRGRETRKNSEFSPKIQLSDNGLGNTYLAQSMPLSTSILTTWHSFTSRYCEILNNEILNYAFYDVLKTKMNYNSFIISNHTNTWIQQLTDSFSDIKHSRYPTKTELALKSHCKVTTRNNILEFQ